MPSDLKPLSNFGDFLIGIAAAGFYERSKSYLSGRGYWLYLPAVAVALTVTSAPHLIAPWMRLDSAMRVLNAILLVGLALGGGWAIRAFSTPHALLLGKTSYAIYILHIPLLWWYKRTWFYESGVLPLPFAGLVYMIFVVAVATVVFVLLEEPANNRLRDFLSARLAPMPHVAKAKLSETAIGQELKAEQPLGEPRPRRRITQVPRLGRPRVTVRT
jgi:peptidoglycan/LPS O-acetylase OafA/YrhL